MARRRGDINFWSDSKRLVHGSVDPFTYTERGKRKKGLAIYEFWSDVPGQGNAKRALQELRKTYKWIVVIDIGRPRTNSRKFWLKMAKDGFVDELEDDENKTVYKRKEPK